MENETEVIRQQMEETRSSLSDKLEVLEQQVTNTVMDATKAVSQTVEAVKETAQSTVNTVQSTVNSVTDSVQAVKESIKESLDITGHVERHPWAAVGASVACGYLLGLWVRPRHHARVMHPFPSPGNGEQFQRAQEPGFVSHALDDLQSKWRPLIQKVKSLALGAATGLIGEMLVNATPPSLKNEVAEMVDQFTVSLGVKNMRPVFQHDNKSDLA